MKTKIKLHNPDDPVILPVWVEWFPISKEKEDTFKWGKVPFMSTGKHLPRYKEQKELEYIYLHYKGQEMIDKLVIYLAHLDNPSLQ
tara:strand:- start:19 stop:276 length:258 start_codon:yes stop_codon:yes gene_type:complete